MSVTLITSPFRALVLALDIVYSTCTRYGAGYSDTVYHSDFQRACVNIYIYIYITPHLRPSIHRREHFAHRPNAVLFLSISLCRPSKVSALVMVAARTRQENVAVFELQCRHRELPNADLFWDQTCIRLSGSMKHSDDRPNWIIVLMSKLSNQLDYSVNVAVK